MRYTTTCALAACLGVAAAFKDTSPFLLLSTNESPSTLGSSQLQSSTDVLNFTKQFIDECFSESYVIVRQGGISAADLSKSKAAPHLQKLMSNEQLNTKLSITEVVGEVDAEELINYISTKCDALKLHLDPRGVLDSPLIDEHKSLVLSIEMDSLPIETSERVAQLVENDYLLQSIIDALPSKYTVIYTTTPVSTNVMHKTPSYQPDFMEPLHMDLKRQSIYDATAKNKTARDDRPLFEKYQFLTPGLFMGILVSLIFLAILWVGVSAVASLQVSYGAFDKEMGPAAQKKQQ